MKQPNEQQGQQALVKKRFDMTDFDEALEFAQQGGGDYGDSTDAVDIRGYWLAVRKRLWLVLLITLTATIAVTIYMARKPDVYEAEARVQVDLEINGEGSLSKGGQVIVSNPGTDPNYFNTQLQILAGPGLLRRVARTLDLEHNRDFFRPPDAQMRSTWQNVLHMFNLGGRMKSPPTALALPPNVAAQSLVTPSSMQETQAEAEKAQPYVSFLQRNLLIDPVKDTRLIDISFRHVDAATAAKVVNTIAETFVLSNLEKKTNANSTQAEFLQKRVAELQADIRNGEERLLNYTKNSQVVSFEPNNPVVERLVGLNQQLLQVESERKAAQAAYQAAQAPGAAEALITETQQSPQAQTALAQLRQKREQLLAKTTEEWPEVKAIDREIAELQRQLDTSKKQSVATLLTNLKTRYDQALAREQSIRSSFEQQKGETLAQNQAAINFKILQQEVETNKVLLSGLLQRSKENDVLMAGMTNNIHVVDYAVQPRSPVGVNRLTGVALTIPLSALIGIGLALLLHYADDTVKSETEVEKYLRLPTIGLIPALAKRQRPRVSSGRGGDNPQSMILNGDRTPFIAEAYRHLRTSLLLSSVERPPRTILVTSTLPKEGKTTTAVNLAITLVQSGASVLLIDGDLRRPNLHNIFGLDNDFGLSTVISGNIGLDRLKTMISQDEETGLSLLTAGPRPPNPADHLGSEKMRALLGILEGEYSHVIIDSPPLCVFTDGTLLSTMSDSVLLVVEAGKGSYKGTRRAKRMLDDAMANVIGVVLNKAPVSSLGAYYYYPGYYEENGKNGNGGKNGKGHTHDVQGGAVRPLGLS